MDIYTKDDFCISLIDINIMSHFLIILFLWSFQ
jgi:hypothetical protein